MNDGDAAGHQQDQQRFGSGAGPVHSFSPRPLFYETCFHPSTRLFFPQLHFLSPSLGIDGLSVAVRTGAELKNSTLQLLFPRVVFVCSDIVPALLSPPNFIRAVSADKECVNWD